ncbi:unnamed protein product [Miscanthus lutarioriparius]|uniref:Uncharacterized protein n=1 Tax=Miscanthus lutarioriparius TaxID=422564 RepID=A0A811QNA7_9POAL|nr:unnamed protein product [Miscanthus lutarioriparius]
MGDPQKSEDRMEIPTDRYHIHTGQLAEATDQGLCPVIPAFASCGAASSQTPPSASSTWIIMPPPHRRSRRSGLLVTETRKPGRSDDASFFNLSSATALSQVAIPSGYRLAGVCNDWLCFALDHDQAPAVVCNPVTGETLQLPKAPPLPAGDPQLSHLFVLGLSATTKEYKMFRVSFPRRHASREMRLTT